MRIWNLIQQLGSTHNFLHGFSAAVLGYEVVKVHGIIYMYLVATSKLFFFVVFMGISKISYKIFNFGVQLNLSIYILDCGFEFYQTSQNLLRFLLISALGGYIYVRVLRKISFSSQLRKQLNIKI